MKIPILHLEDGIHHLDKTIKSESLNFYQQVYFPHPIEVGAELNKFEKNIQCRIALKTTAVFQCDRCLNMFEQLVDLTFQMLLHVGSTALETDEDDVINVPGDVVELDIRDRIAEQLILAVPMKSVCREDCQGMCGGCGKDLNVEECQCEETPMDPRWEKLKALKK